jgi:hypothetical protein
MIERIAKSLVFVALLSGVLLAGVSLAQDAGSDVVYGPIAAEPLTSCPTDSVRLLPTGNAQLSVEAAPAGTTFCFTAGTYTNITITPRTGDTFIGVQGAILDGSGITEQAFRSVFEPNVAEPIRDVTIRGLIIQNYVTDPSYREQLTPRGAVEANQGWIIEYNTIQDNQSGLTLGYTNWQRGDGAIVRHNRIINNLYIGIESNGSNILFEHNELAGNGWNLTDEERIWSGGGSKFADMGLWADNTFTDSVEIERAEDEHLVIRNNHIHSNMGHGIWLDINNRNAIIENNLFEFNYGSGFFDELSNGTTVRNNIFRDNRSGNMNNGYWGGAEILVANSQRGQIYENDITVNGTSRAVIIIFELSRDYAPGRDYTVRDNIIRLNIAPTYDGNNVVAGVLGGFGEGSFYQDNNGFDGNTYYLPDASANHFFWGQQMNWAGFRAAGQEANGECFVGESETPC